ncbi:peptidase family C50-domain-containing protein [Syncephalis fuscata]|nr:peptidase family C50-domain-containing protein [Syncephalis fuscata]
MIQRWLSSLCLASQLYMQQGSFKESDYYLDQAQQLAETVGAQVLLQDILCSRARLAYLRHQHEQSTTWFNTVQHHHLIQQANEHHYRGEQASYKREWQIAQNHFNKVEELLAVNAQQSFIDSLENKAGWQWWSSIEPSNEQNLPFLHCTLERSNFLRGWTASQYGDYRTARSCFDTLSLSYLMPEYTLWRAKSVLHELMMTVSDNSVFGKLHDSILSIGLTQLIPTASTASSSRTAARRESHLHFSHTLMTLEESLVQAYTTGYNTLSPALLRELCHTLARIQVMTAYCTMSTEGNKLVSSNQPFTWSALFYLEMAKNITLRREIGTLLKEQLEHTVISANNTTSDTKQNGHQRRLIWPDMNEPLMDNITSESTKQCLKRYRLYEQESKLTVDDWIHSYVKNLPDHILVCTLSVHEETGALYVGRYGSFNSGIEPCVLRLPLKRKASRDVNEETTVMSYKEACDTLASILEESRLSMRIGRASMSGDGHHSGVGTETSTTPELSRKEKAAWWDRRHALDRQLAQLLERLEEDWWGGFRGLLRPSSLPVSNTQWSAYRQEFGHRLGGLLHRTVSTLRTRKVPRLEISPTLCDLLLYAGGQSTTNTTPTEADEADQRLSDDVEDILYYLLDTYMYHGVTVPFDEIEFDQVLIEMKAMVMEWQQMHHTIVHTVTSSTSIVKSVVLILDKSTHMFPWENMPLLRGQSVSRLPTWTLWRDNVQLSDPHYCVVNGQQTQYLLNPAGDLLNTEAELAPLMKRQKWKGITGRIPMEQELRTSLSTSDIFLYFGHGGAEQYIKGSTIRKLDRCAVTLLMGCSSGYLAPEGEFEPTGTPWHYLIAGSRGVVVNLWDVTDKDIDRFSMALLKQWGLAPVTASTKGRGQTTLKQPLVPVNLATAVAIARKECTLGYLVGAAPVIYGIPYLTVERV